jgi:hypothetical protein
MCEQDKSKTTNLKGVLGKINKEELDDDFKGPKKTAFFSQSKPLSHLTF